MLVCVASMSYLGYRYHRATRIVEAAVTSPAPAYGPVGYQPVDIREQRAMELLAALGNAQPTYDIISEVVSWSLAEDSGSGALDRNNPWNTTMCGFNMVGSINADGACGVGHYATPADGIAANAATLAQGNFADVRNALLSNDVDGFKRALWSSQWAASHYDYGAAWPAYQYDKMTRQDDKMTSNPIALSNDTCGWNVRVALDANSGALQHVILQPNETFSFNATMGDPAVVEYHTCAGVPGGNWCNLAARYAQVARSIGLTPQFQDHGVGDLGAGAENSVAIWNEGGIAGVGQDLLITNTTGRVVTFQAQQHGDSVVIVGSVA